MNPENSQEVTLDAPITSDILRGIMARLWMTTSMKEPILALESFDGPYAGVIFSFKKFEVANTILPNGYHATKFETAVHKSPEGFEADEAFDRWCGEVLLAWLHHLHTTDLKAVSSAIPKQGVH